jgi:hypothetical protein
MGVLVAVGSGGTGVSVGGTGVNVGGTGVDVGGLANRIAQLNETVTVRNVRKTTPVDFFMTYNSF